MPLLRHCSHMGPHLETRVPMGTFFSFWVPIRSPLGPIRSPFSILGLRTREKSVQPPSNIDYLITCDNTEFIQYKWHKHCALNDEHLCEYFFKQIFISTNYLVSVNFSNIRFLGPHFCCRGSPLGPHFTQN